MTKNPATNGLNAELPDAASIRIPAEDALVVSGPLPGENTGTPDLADVLDVQAIQSTMDSFSDLTRGTCPRGPSRAWRPAAGRRER